MIYFFVLLFVKCFRQKYLQLFVFREGREQKKITKRTSNNHHQIFTNDDWQKRMTADREAIHGYQIAVVCWIYEMHFIRHWRVAISKWKVIGDLSYNQHKTNKSDRKRISYICSSKEITTSSILNSNLENFIWNWEISFQIEIFWNFQKCI